MAKLDFGQDKKIKVTQDGVYLLDEDIKKQINRKRLSASLINAINQSPGEWLLSSFIEPLVSDKEPIYFARGHWFHSVMEEHFQNPDHSPETLKEDFIRATKKQPKFAKEPKKDEDLNQYMDLMKDKESKAWMKGCLKGYIDLAKKNGFYDKKVAQLFSKGQQTNGVEFFAINSLPDIENSCLGFIDCLFETPDGLRIIDWKTGKFHKGDAGYELQQTFYTILLEKEGFKVGSAALVFPVSNVIEEINVHDPDVRDRVMNEVRMADKTLSKCKKENFYPFKKHKWNSWQSFLTGVGTARKPDINEELFYHYADLSELI